jgi:predicted transcriptional regulator
MTGKGSDIRLTNSQWREDNKKFILDNNIRIVVFDNLSSLAPDINENDKKEFDVINQYFISLRALGITVFVLHHTGKNGDQRGTSARKDQVDNFIYLRAVANHDYIKDGPRFKLSFDKSRIVLEEIKDNELVHAKELWYQRTTRNTFEWTFDAVSLEDDPEFIKHMVDGLTQREIAKLHNISVSTVNRKITRLIEKELIEKDGRKYKLTEQGRDNYPSVVDWLEFGV